MLGMFFGLGARSHQLALAWLLVGSILFYSWWDVRNVPLLMVSIVFNYFAGKTILSRVARNDQRRASQLLWLAVSVNLIVLGYFKYSVFVSQNIAALLGYTTSFQGPGLPLGISFFTFTQIAFLVDCRRRELHALSPLGYGIFVTYFPHLIAGPILHHTEMIPQFSDSRIFRFSQRNFAVGMTIFIIGLCKKVILADHVATIANPVFAAAGAGGHGISFLEAWIGVLAYTAQIYFDFSGYSDMAIGLSKMLNVNIPINFNSPYKARSIIDFWHRWHMTLSRFLRDYVYIALGGNRRGPTRRYVNLIATMLIGGLWHGAGWTFVAWGGLHGTYLLINHLWRNAVVPVLSPRVCGHPLYTLACHQLTFLAVVLAWVFFRAETFDKATDLLRGMMGLNGIYLPGAYRATFGFMAEWLSAIGVGWVDQLAYFGMEQAAWVGTLILIAWFSPNTMQLTRRFRPALGPPSSWKRFLPGCAGRRFGPMACCSGLPERGPCCR